ncbi:G2/mitotic-specific cyclin-B [Condylostylus longicornis]|uniref:G2/mitotic-specific cyclin-B n=1 Tax=Condylostylus longicornis TaxID=2530218 RepID=UPI00244DA131|nr:G2/mitotic-specific cyclin-B [Condylostylus longicornis]
MATGLRKFISDENAIDKVHKMKAQKVSKEITFGKLQKRAALGELGNKAILPNTNTILAKVKEATAQENLKNAKARVDTHWKNNEGRRLIRTESLRLNKNTVNSAKPNVEAAVNSAVTTNKMTLRNATNLKTNGTVSKTITQEQKSTLSKVNRQNQVKKEIPIQKIVVVKPENGLMRREDSNLSRKSLTKLRAVLTKDAAKRDGLVSIKVENCNGTTKKPVKSNAQSIDIPKQKTIKAKEGYLTETTNVEAKSGFEDIDANDIENIFALTEYVNDIFKYLNELEVIFKIDEDFMKNQIEVTPRMRTVLLDWINEVASQFRLLAETYQITVGIIDRYLQIIPNTTRGQLQLVGVTALFIATKYEELFYSDIGDFIYMTDNSYTKEDILNMEKKIMRALDFQLSRPFPLQFLKRFAKAINAEQHEYSLAKYILELVSIEYSLAHYKPSEIAAAALFLSVSLLNIKKKPTDDIWNKTVEHYSTYSSTYLKPLVKKIAVVLKNAPKAKVKSIYTKHRSEKYFKISTRPELYGKTIDSIINSDE